MARVVVLYPPRLSRHTPAASDQQLSPSKGVIRSPSFPSRSRGITRSRLFTADNLRRGSASVLGGGRLPSAMARDQVHVGLIADTHGLLRPEAMEALRGSDYLVHAGDIGDPQILKALAEIAPVTAVRGNNDQGTWAAPLHTTEVLQIGETLVYVIHDLADLDLDPGVAGFRAVVSGHSHRPGCESRHGVLFVNPGSAGPRRFRLPVCVGRLIVSAVGVEARLVELPVKATAATARSRRRAVRHAGP